MSDAGPGRQPPQYLSTTQVASALGVSVTTVKRWVDESILPAHKTVGGHRKLLLADVLVLVKGGRFPQADLSRLISGAGPSRPVEPQALGEDLFVALRDGDSARVTQLLKGAWQSGMPLETLADQVVHPVMARIGHEWEADRMDVMHEHRATQAVKSSLYEIKALLESNARRDRPVAVGGAPESDYYNLPTMLAQLVLLDAGWNAVNLGHHTPMAGFRRALNELRPRLIWVSCTNIVDAERFLAEFAALYREAERAGTAVAVGGRALVETGGLRSRMPYTTYGDGLTHLAAFARTLHPRPSRPRRGRPPRWTEHAE